MSLLAIAASALAIGMAMSERASWLEAISFVTGATCVWLTVKESVWNFPIGLANVATFSIVFFDAKLFADAGLQVVYFVLGVIGWYLWLHGGERRAPLRVSLSPAGERVAAIAAAIVLTLVLWQALRHVGGSASFWDALTTSVSLAAQWLINKKRLESWMLWIAVDAIYVPLYLSKDLVLTAILYGVFLIMAVIGLLEWRGTWQRQRAAAVP